MIPLKENPFLSNSYTQIWLKQFGRNKQPIDFSCIKGVKFIGTRIPFLFKNIGRTHTKGVGYEISNNGFKDYRKKVCLIYDIPRYLEVDRYLKFDLENLYPNLGRYISKQYPGFAIRLNKYEDFNQYMLATFSKSSRYKLNKYNRRLDQCFSISSKMYLGKIPKSEYDFLFDCFRSLLRKRFDQKRTTNNNLKSEEWKFYYEVAYPLILEKKASLFVLYHNEKPISITLNYLSERVIFDAITVFDVDYSKFHLGSVTFLRLISWSFENNMQIFDFSKGYFDYKVHWSDLKYDFEYHLLYDKKSFRSSVLAFHLKMYFDIKQFLRKKRVNDRLHKFQYRILNIGKIENQVSRRFHFKEIANIENIESGKLLNVKDDIRLMAPLCEFLYLNNENYEDTIIYKSKDSHLDYIFKGKIKSSGLKFNN